MSTQEKLKAAEQRLARLERNKAMQSIKKRKQDTRRKIELGGLVIKSELSQYNKDVILGALIDAVNQLLDNPDLKRLWQLKGQQAFLETEK